MHRLFAALCLARATAATLGPQLVDLLTRLEEAVAGIEQNTRSLAEDDPRRALAEELAWARRFADRVAGQAQPRALVLSDTHPGNFLRAADGKASRKPDIC